MVLKIVKRYAQENLVASQILWFINEHIQARNHINAHIVTKNLPQEVTKWTIYEDIPVKNNTNVTIQGALKAFSDIIN